MARKTIAIIGATSLRGTAIARSLANTKQHLLLMSDEKDQLEGLIKDLKEHSMAEVEAISCAKEACWEADIIILASAKKEVAEKIKEVAIGKIVVSVSNPQENIGQLTDTSLAEELQRELPYSKVVKTFNTSQNENFISPVIDGKSYDTFIAGNNSDAIESVSELIRSIGLNPFVVGDLSMSRALERMHQLLIRKTIEHNNGLAF
ncbi:MAG: NAD(P)-binding domain-containing protein [Cyclobacteriaceae bacterium]